MIPQTESRRQDKKPATTSSDTVQSSPPQRSADSWQQALADVVRDPAELLALLELDDSGLPALQQACQDFPLKVPRSFIRRMNKGDWLDPLLLQVLPQAREMELLPGYSGDPLDEANSNPLPGLVHKYRGRVLLVVSGGCAVNCRYCFRRHFPYQDNNPGRAQWQAVIDYIAADDSIHEVILSGGDPLVSSDRLLAGLIEQLESIAHVDTLRLHSRLPVVIPERIDAGLLQLLTGSRLKAVMVIHSNHPRELDHEVEQAMQRMNRAGITVLNQTVLLAGINDNADTLQLLSRRLFQCGVLPYYLHLLDRVQGAAHFDTEREWALSLHSELLASLPGYLVPKLVRETPDANSKLPIYP